MTGYRVEVDSLRAFATQVRGLLNEFENGAGGNRVHGQTGVGRSAFGTFVEAEALHEKYETMRANLRDVLNTLQMAIDDVQHKAEVTATNYEEQEHETTQTLKVTTDGWSVTTPGVGSQRNSSTTRVSYNPGAPATPATGGEAQQTW